MTETIKGIISGVAIAILFWIGSIIKSKIRVLLDRNRIYKWLKSNTRDEPGESHVDIVTLAKGTKLPEDRVRRACMSDKRIYHHASEFEEWSVWRKEPQSIYEKRGPLIF
jgi:hypothetical protein